MKQLLADSPEELRNRFFDLRHPSDIGSLLGIEYKKLITYLYTRDLDEQYRTFKVPKRSGGTRIISAPHKHLKFLQRKLAEILQTVYETGASVHGFVYGRSILTNAANHARKRFVLNVDLKDFFPSINFGRVRGVFIHRYGIDPAVATVLAQLCCLDNELPQGAPTSPVVSNIICAPMDNQLAQLASREGCKYTRYADDMTFSTSDPYFPHILAREIHRDGRTRVRVGEELLDIIYDNGFGVRSDKTRLQKTNERQVVTGLVVNRLPNVRRTFVRQIRAMLHAWRKFGHDAAEEEHYRKYNKKYRGPFKGRPAFKDIVRGKIEFVGMVRGRKDRIYVRYWNQLVELAPKFGSPIPEHHAGKGQQRLNPAEVSARLFTEGKTDWKHLKSALTKFRRHGHYQHLNVQFRETEDAVGDQDLLRMLEAASQLPNLGLSIYIFDRDNKSVVKKVTDGKRGFKKWNDSVYSFALPVPDHREDTPDVCIELFYPDSDLKRVDSNGRRLFLSTEFHRDSFRHIENPDLSCADRNIFRGPQPQVVDSQVFDGSSKPVALAKNDFAELVLGEKGGFANVDISEFAKVFDLIWDIVVDYAKADDE